MKKQITFKQLKCLVKESFDDEAPEVAYTVRNNAQTFSHSDQPKEYGTYHTEEDAEKMRQWLAKEDPEGWNPKYTEVVQKELDPMLPIHWSKVADLDEAKKVNESDEDEIDLQFSNQVLNRIEKLASQGKDQLGNLERNPRKIPVTAVYRLDITQTMKEIRRLAHLIVDQMKD